MNKGLLYTSSPEIKATDLYMQANLVYSAKVHGQG